MVTGAACVDATKSDVAMNRVEIMLFLLRKESKRVLCFLANFLALKRYCVGELERHVCDV